MPYEKIGNNEPVCIADVVPFEIPDSWEWVRFSHISSVITKGTTPRGGNVAYLTEGIGFLRAENVAGLNKIDKTDMKYIDEKIHNGYLNRSILEENVILITIAGTLGRTAIVNSEDLPLNVNQAVSIVRLIDNTLINLNYLIFAINSPLIQQMMTKQKKITAIPNLTLEIIADCFVPIPPLKEQDLIVKEIEKYLPLLSQYEEKETEIIELNLSFPKQLKKSILQEAVQGKLVPQDENDEPASVLLDRIRAEKDALIKSGKIKKDKNKSIIFRRDNSHYEKFNGVERCIYDEIPFEIPENWTWCRLGMISSYAQSKVKINAQNADKDLWELDLEDIEKGGNIIDFKTVRDCDAKGDKTFFQKGNILYSKLRPYLLKILVAPADGICTPEIVPFEMYGDINAEYIVLLLKSPYIDNYINSITYGVKMPRVGTETMVNLLIPLPPLAEQYRIVSQIAEIMPFIDNLTQ